jgi:TetR/AcrR family transcriptional regulator, regulator of cefoperazone and chloramphenicol sensitivity
MAKRSQRKYDSSRRTQQAEQTRDRILDAARRVISQKGFADATFEAIAGEAGVAVPTVYAAFGSKSGIMQALMGRAAFSSNYGDLVREANKSDDPATRLRFAARIARGIFDALRSESEVLRGATAIAPDFIRERERIRYERQAGLIKLLEEKKALRAGISASMARDILWTLTSYDIHRRLVVERQWSAGRYEEWLGDTLIASLLQPKKKKGEAD